MRCDPLPVNGVLLEILVLIRVQEGTETLFSHELEVVGSPGQVVLPAGDV